MRKFRFVKCSESFGGFCLPKYKKSSPLRKYNKFFSGFFSGSVKKAFSWEIFSGRIFLFLKFGLKNAGFLFRKYQKSFLLRKNKTFFQSKFSLEKILEIFLCKHFDDWGQNVRQGGNFGGLRTKCALGSRKIYYWVTVRDPSRKVKHMGKVVWDRKIRIGFARSISYIRIG